MTGAGAQLRALAVGVGAALSLPHWLGGSRLAELLRDIGPVAPHYGDPAEALANGQRALRVLARAHLPWWRNTCLYRALVECLVLRSYGVPCRVELGVRRIGEPGTITAHAWVVRADATALG